MSDYIVKYNVLLNDAIISDKIIKVKNKPNEAIALWKLEKYLRRKYGGNFRALQVKTITTDHTQDVVNLFRRAGLNI